MVSLQKFLFVLFFFISTLTLQAQVTKNTFSFNGGYSLPVGEFASEHLDDPRAGLAGDGYYGVIAYERRLTPWIGLRFSGSHNINTTNTDPIAERAGHLVDMYRELINENGTYTWATNARKWNMSSAMVGPVIYIHLGKVQLTGHAQAGRLFVKSPYVTINGVSTSERNPINAEMNAIDTQTWGVGGGVSLRIPVAKYVRFQLTAEALAGQAKFEGIAIKGTVGGYEHTQLMDEKRSVGLVNVGAGFVIDF